MNFQLFPTLGAQTKITNSNQAITLARYYSLHNLYIQESIPGFLPVLTSKLPENCQFLQWFEDQHNYLNLSYTSYIMQIEFINAEQAERQIYFAKNMKDFFENIRRYDFLYLEGSLQYNFDYFHLIPKYFQKQEINDIASFLLQKAVQYRKALPVFNFEFVVQEKYFKEKDEWVNLILRDKLAKVRERLGKITENSNQYVFEKTKIQIKESLEEFLGTNK